MEKYPNSGNQFGQLNPQKKSKSSNKKYVYAIIAILLVIAIVAGGWLIINAKKNKEAENEQKLLENLESSTSKPVVEFMCDDFDVNGTVEAFAVVGETDDADAEYPEYYNADIFYVYEEGAEIIREDVDGKSNGTIIIDDTNYVSLEIYEDDTDEGYSFIYTSSDDTYEEPDISGEYSNVYEEDGEVVGFDNGKKINIIDYLSKEDSTSQKNNIVQPTEEDWKLLDDFITKNQVNSFYRGQHTLEDTFDVNDSDAIDRAYSYVSGFCGISNVYCYFYDMEQNVDAFESENGTGNFAQPDPLGMFNNNPVYYRYSADKIDWIIENVFNLKPDRSFSKCDTESYTFYYYHGDYFYIGGGYAGDIGYDYKTEKKTELEDGKYKVEIYGYNNYIDPMYESYGEASQFKIIATVALKEVDGKRFWSFYTYEWAENK